MELVRKATTLDQCTTALGIYDYINEQIDIVFVQL